MYRNNLLVYLTVRCSFLSKISWNQRQCIVYLLDGTCKCACSRWVFGHLGRGWNTKNRVRRRGNIYSIVYIKSGEIGHNGPWAENAGFKATMPLYHKPAANMQSPCSCLTRVFIQTAYMAVYSQSIPESVFWLEWGARMFETVFEVRGFQQPCVRWGVFLEGLPETVFWLVLAI